MRRGFYSHGCEECTACRMNRMERKERGMMIVNQKPTGTARSMPAGLAMGWSVSAMITAVSCGLLAWLILSGKTGWEAMGYGVMGILFAASYAGAAVSCKAIMHRKLFVCVLSGILYLCSLAAVVLLMFGGQLGSIWISGLLVAGGAGAAALVHCAEKKENRRRRRKRRL